MLYDVNQTQDAIYATTQRPVDPIREIRNDLIAFYLGRRTGRVIRKRVLKTS
jgi:hypothetical protein